MALSSPMAVNFEAKKCFNIIYGKALDATQPKTTVITSRIRAEKQIKSCYYRSSVPSSKAQILYTQLQFSSLNVNTYSQKHRKRALICSVHRTDVASVDLPPNGAVSDTITDSLGSSNPVSESGSPQDFVVSTEVLSEVAIRLRRLQVLVSLRQLYRGVLRSERVLRMPIPRVSRVEEGSGGEEGEARKKRMGGGRRRRIQDWIRKEWRGGEEEEEEKEVELLVETPLEVLDCAEDIRDLARGLRGCLVGLGNHLGDVFQDQPKAEGTIKMMVADISDKLVKLSNKVETSLSEAERDEAERQRAEMDDRDEEGNVQTRVLRRLEKSLPDTGFVIDSVRRRIATVNLANVNLNFLQRGAYDVLRTVTDVWLRLNGRASASDDQGFISGLPKPASVAATEGEKKLALILEVEALDKKLGEVSRMREQRLRQKNALARTRLASEIRAMDDEVNEVRKALAVRSLQVEMSLIYLSLEEELLDITGSEDLRSSEEESLLVAEFGLLDADLARLRTSVDRKEAILVDDDELEVLAVDIPDLKMRLGIVEEASIPIGQRLTITWHDSVSKLKIGASFYWRGMRLLGGDVAYSVRLFWAAVIGTTLKPREVQAVRRTAKDVLVLIPFAVILIAPITPMGHVLVFSFLQKYFPGFFPSSFSPKRQEVMKRYEMIKENLQLADSDRDKEEALAMAALAEAETFETSEEDSTSGQSGAGSHGDSGSQFKRRSALERVPRRLTDRQINLTLLQEQLPEIAKILKDLQFDPISEDRVRSVKTLGTDSSVDA